MLEFILAQSSADYESAAGAAVVAGLVFFFIYLAAIIITIVGIWKMFAKAGKPGWAAIVPIYNIIVLLEIVGKPIWWIILFLIPFVNIIMGIIVTHEASKAFGRGLGTTIGLIILPFIFYPVLGFGSAQYKAHQAA